MPHLIIDYSPNLEDALDWPAFCDLLRCAAIETGVFPMAGVRVRAIRADHVSIADGDPQHGYIDLSVRLRGGPRSGNTPARHRRDFRRSPRVFGTCHGHPLSRPVDGDAGHRP